MELTKTTETTTNETISETKGGVYKITCTPLNKVYIGRSKNINQRKAEHFSDLRNNVHKCKEMQKDFNQYGENAFTFSIAEECDEEKAIWLEDYYMFHCSAFSHGYNTKRGDIINAKEKCIGDNVVECENVREKTFLEEAEEEKRSEQIRTCNYKDVSAQWLVFRLNQRIIAGNAQFTGIAAGRGVSFTTGLLLLREGLGMRETPIRPHS